MLKIGWFSIPAGTKRQDSYYKPCTITFKIDQESMCTGVKKCVQEHAFLHVGRHIHMDIIKSSLKDNGAAFIEV